MYQEKADRAEQWLHKVYTEIEDRFLRQDEGRRGSPQRRQGAKIRAEYTLSRNPKRGGKTRLGPKARQREAGESPFVVPPRGNRSTRECGDSIAIGD